MACIGCILDFLHCFVCQSYPKYPNCHISASIRVFDPISSPFLIFFHTLLMALGWLVFSAFWPFCTVLCINPSPNTQTAISWLLFVCLTPSLHHSSSVQALQVFLCTVNGSRLDCFVCILTLLHCFVCQLYPK